MRDMRSRSATHRVQFSSQHTQVHSGCFPVCCFHAFARRYQSKVKAAIAVGFRQLQPVRVTHSIRYYWVGNLKELQLLHYSKLRKQILQQKVKNDESNLYCNANAMLQPTLCCASVLGRMLRKASLPPWPSSSFPLQLWRVSPAGSSHGHLLSPESSCAHLPSQAHIRLHTSLRGRTLLRLHPHHSGCRIRPG